MATIKELENKYKEVIQEISDKYYELVQKIQGDNIRLSNYTNWQDSDLCVSAASKWNISYIDKLLKAVKRNGNLVVYDVDGNTSECNIEYIPESEWILILYTLEKALDKPKAALNTRDVMNNQSFDKEFFEGNDLDYKSGIDLFTEEEVDKYIENFTNIDKYNLPEEISINWVATYERYKLDFIQINHNGQRYYIID